MARAARRAKTRPRAARLDRKAASLLRWERVCRFATTAPGGGPHVVPVCYVLVDGKLYVGSGRDARKVAHVKANGRAAIAVDLYSDNWVALRGVMVQGAARLIEGGASFRRVRRLLYQKYPQYPGEAALDESDSVIIEVTPTHVFSWGLG